MRLDDLPRRVVGFDLDRADSNGLIQSTYEARADYLRGYQRDYRTENRDAIREYQRAWRERNREAVRERQHQWYLANSQHVTNRRGSAPPTPEKLYRAEYYQKNREALKARARARYHTRKQEQGAT